jgi:hypothetical protein
VSEDGHHHGEGRNQTSLSGHFNGRNFETKQRLDDEVTISKDVLSGKMKGEPNQRAMMGLDLVVTSFLQ